MQRGVVERRGGDGWRVEYRVLELFLVHLLKFPKTFAYRRRYRVGKRAVMLWPESEMGKVVELG